MAVGHNSLGHIAVVVHSPMYDPEAFDVEIGYLLTAKAPESLRLSEERTLTRRELPAIDKIATLVHMGRVSDNHRSYGVLANWLEQNQWQIIGTGREILMQLPVPDQKEEAVIEIQLPVCRSSENNGG